MKTLSALIAIAAISLPLNAMATGSHNSNWVKPGCGDKPCTTGDSWTTWNEKKSGTFSQDGKIIKVTYEGDFLWNDDGDHKPYVNDGYHDIFGAVPSSFTHQGSRPQTSQGSIAMDGEGKGIFKFSQKVFNPILALWSVGQMGTKVTFDFDTANFVILTQGKGAWGANGSSLVKDGDKVIGEEGNGLVQFIGWYDSIAFALPNKEHYFGATVGAPCQVPVPAALPLMVSGLAMLGFGSARRRKVT